MQNEMNADMRIVLYCMHQKTISFDLKVYAVQVRKGTKKRPAWNGTVEDSSPIGDEKRKSSTNSEIRNCKKLTKQMQTSVVIRIQIREKMECLRIFQSFTFDLAESAGN